MTTKPRYRLALLALGAMTIAGLATAQAPVPRSQADVVVIKGPRHTTGLATAAAAQRSAGAAAPGVSRPFITTPAHSARAILPHAIAPAPLARTTGLHAGREVKP